jgi:predicted DNA-binding protein
MAKAKTNTQKETEKEMDVSLTIKLPSALRNKARTKSENTGVSLSFVVRKALEEWTAEQTKK